jgi:hypothetical protein
MKNDIEKALLRLDIESREIRKSKELNLGMTIAVSILLFLVIYFVPALFLLVLVEALLIFLGGIAAVIDWIPSILRPLEPEFRAFKSITRAVDLLKKSDDDLAYKEAYRHVKHAYGILKSMALYEKGWYKEINRIVDQFVENFQLYILPAIADSTIMAKDLEDIAMAIYSLKPSKIATANEMIEKTYEKGEPPQTVLEIFTKKLRETTVGNVAYSLALGYGLILGICMIYVALTGQDFMAFVKERPDVVILGGGVFSGLTFWKTKPHTELKSIE